MAPIVWHSFWLAPTLFGVTAFSAFAQTDTVQSAASQNSVMNQVSAYSAEGQTGAALDQVTSVSQLTDIQPTDWAFQALQSLVEQYGCLIGYPDRTYRGNRAMTRFEFAAGLNACLDKIQELISTATTDLVQKEDLEVVKKLQEEFAAELASLRGRVESLEARTSTLEKQQFSTTTKLSGEVIFALTDEFSDRENSTVFQNRVRLTLTTSFSGKDRLVTRLDAGNAALFQSDELPGIFVGSNPAGIVNLSEGLQTHNVIGGGGNSVQLGHLAYYTSVFSDHAHFYIPAVGGTHYYYAPTLNPTLDSQDGGSSTLSVFGQRNPIYEIGGGAGIGLNFKLGSVILSAGYLANTANNPASGNGLFDGNYAGLFQVAYAGDRVGIGATYVTAYKTQGEAIFEGSYRVRADGAVGTTYANVTSFFAPTPGLIIGDRAKIDAYGLSGYFKITPKVVLNAFGTYVTADYNAPNVETGEIWTYGLGLSFQDLGKKGNLGGIVIGAQPYLGNPKSRRDYGALAVPIHIEVFYKYQINDHISITPGLIWIQNPGQIKTTDDAFIGTIRTTFTF
ncbi:MAG: carbohydrate porin [Oscillatoriales cyanobacterium C42_A2020_001]|nr:carbohydrate porin [Leptolyngbyaceae cyanobacterium C42_A2020_001]